VQFQKDGQLHSDTDELRKAKLYASSLANWNLEAQIPTLEHVVMERRNADGRHKRSSKTPRQINNKGREGA
jgi:hypothetical protein